MMFINKYAIDANVDGVLQTKCFIDSDDLLSAVMVQGESELAARQTTRQEQSIPAIETAIP